MSLLREFLFYDPRKCTFFGGGCLDFSAGVTTAEKLGCLAGFDWPKLGLGSPFARLIYDKEDFRWLLYRSD